MTPDVQTMDPSQTNRCRLASVACCAAVLLAGGCAAPPVEGAGEFTFTQAEYPAVFEATRDVLDDFGFSLERLDAEAGVVSTNRQFSQGLLEPWSPHQSNLRDEWADAVNRHARHVRVTFVPGIEASTAGRSDATVTGDAMRGSVWVTLYRQHRAGRRLDAEVVGGSTFSENPLLVERHGSTYMVAHRRDEALEARLAAAIADAARDVGAASVVLEPLPIRGPSDPTPRPRLIEPTRPLLGDDKPAPTKGWP